MQSNCVGDFIKKLQYYIALIALIMWKERMKFWHTEVNNKLLIHFNRAKISPKGLLPVRQTDL